MANPSRWRSTETQVVFSCRSPETACFIWLAETRLCTTRYMLKRGPSGWGLPEAIGWPRFLAQDVANDGRTLLAYMQGELNLGVMHETESGDWEREYIDARTEAYVTPLGQISENGTVVDVGPVQIAML